MATVKDLKKGDILSETSYFTFVRKDGDSIIVKGLLDDYETKISNGYCEAVLKSGDNYSEVVKLSQTEIIQIVAANPNTACSIYFKKQDVPKTLKALKEEHKKTAELVKEDFMNRGVIALEEALANPTLTYIPGENRLIKGYYTGNIDERGRFKFCDMECPKALIKGVDTRTIEYVIINDVKYIKK